MKKLATLPVVALLGCLLSVSFAQGPESFKGKPVPAFTLVDTNGKKMTPASLKGKVYLIDFWATWCGPCKAAMPTMQKLHDKYKSKGFMVIGTNIYEHGGPKPDIAGAFKKSSKHTYVFAKNDAGAEKLAETLKVRGIPTFLLVDKKGMIREVQIGFSPAHEAELSKKIEGLLK